MTGDFAAVNLQTRRGFRRAHSSLYLTSTSQVFVHVEKMYASEFGLDISKVIRVLLALYVIDNTTLLQCSDRLQRTKATNRVHATGYKMRRRGL